MHPRCGRPSPLASALVVLALACRSAPDAAAGDGDSGTALDVTSGTGTFGDTSTSTPNAADATTTTIGSSDADTTASSSGSSSSDGPAVLDECAAPEPAWIFCDDFESAGVWDGSVTEPTLVDDAGPFTLDGNHAAQLRVPPGSGGTALYKDLPPHDELFVRFFAMWEPGHDFSARRHGPGGLHGGNTDCVGCSGSQPSDWFTATLETVTEAPFTMQAYTYYPGMYMDCTDPNGACWGDMFPCTAGPSYCTNAAHTPTVEQPGMQTGQWYCLEQMIDAGPPTPGPEGAGGVLDFWIDELEIGAWSGLWLRSSAEVQVDALWIYLYHHAEHSEAGLLIDNVVVSTARIGCPS